MGLYLVALSVPSSPFVLSETFPEGLRFSSEGLGAIPPSVEEMLASGDPGALGAMFAASGDSGAFDSDSGGEEELPRFVNGTQFAGPGRKGRGRGGRGNGRGRNWGDAGHRYHGRRGEPDIPMSLLQDLLEDKARGLPTTRASVAPVTPPLLALVVQSVPLLSLPDGPTKLTADRTVRGCNADAG